MEVLIIGAGCAGPVLAYLLLKSNPKHTITIIERFPGLRLGGQQIDLKGNGYAIVKNMGLLSRFKEAGVNESGLELVDGKGRVLLALGVNEGGAEVRSAISEEYEIMRGDFIKIFHDATLALREKQKGEGKREGGITYHFGVTADNIENDSNGASVTFSDGTARHFDLVVGADGQGSRMRQLMFGKEASAAAFHSLGPHIAYYSIPGTHGDGTTAQVYCPGRGQLAMFRTSGRTDTQVYLLSTSHKDCEALKRSLQQSTEKRKDTWIELYKGGGWELERALSGLKTSTDFHAHELGQVKLLQLHSGRAVLIGDAAYCPSPLTGMGTTLGLTGAYVLAGELANHPNDIDAALAAYSEKMKQPVTQGQVFSKNFLKAIPHSRLRLHLQNAIVWLLYRFKLEGVIGWIFSLLAEKEEPLWKVPEYPSLNLAAEEASAQQL